MSGGPAHRPGSRSDPTATTAAQQQPQAARPGNPQKRRRRRRRHRPRQQQRGAGRAHAAQQGGPPQPQAQQAATTQAKCRRKARAPWSAESQLAVAATAVARYSFSELTAEFLLIPKSFRLTGFQNQSDLHLQKSIRKAIVTQGHRRGQTDTAVYLRQTR